ncbi:MAG: DUF5777 family beta-barrel protein [Ignavibacteriota bacterium]
MKKYLSGIVLAVSLLFSADLFAQDTGSLLDLVTDSVASTEYVSNAFKSSRVINGQSIEMLGAGSLDFRILHRFGPVNGGIDKFFGLDQSTVRLSFDYAPINDLLVGIGRSTVRKELDGFVKYRLLHQSRGERTMPVSVILVAGVTCQTLPYADETVTNFFTSRLTFFQQIIIGSKISDLFSFQISPTLIHRNLVTVQTDPNDIYAVGLGGRIKLTNRLALTFDWYHPFNGVTPGVNFDPIAIGFDIETGGHVFQVHLSNSVGMNERAFITETYNNWLKGGIQLGFNISRIFQL